MRAGLCKQTIENGGKMIVDISGKGIESNDWFQRSKEEKRYKRQKLRQTKGSKNVTQRLNKVGIKIMKDLRVETL